jgi:hypothetical protein
MRNLKHKENLGGIRVLRCPKPMFIGTKTFMKFITKGDAFFIYTFPSLDVERHPHEILPQYQEFKDVFEKKCEHLAQALTI